MSATRLVYTPDDPTKGRILTHYAPAFMAQAVVADIAARYGQRPTEIAAEPAGVYMDGGGSVLLGRPDVVVPLGSYAVCVRECHASAVAWGLRTESRIRRVRIGRYRAVKFYDRFCVSVFLERDLKRIADALAVAAERAAPDVAAVRASLAGEPHVHVAGVAANVEPF